MLETEVTSIKLPHRLNGLLWAELTSDTPFKKARVRRSCFKDGIAYEKLVGRELRALLRAGVFDGELLLGQWILFCDNDGISYAQPDAYIVSRQQVLLFEAKLTQTDAARPQLDLYEGLLNEIYGRPIRRVQVCKHLRYVPQDLIEGPHELAAAVAGGDSTCWTWHFLGR